MDKSNDTCVVNNNMDGNYRFVRNIELEQLSPVLPWCRGLWGNYYRLEWLPPDRLKLKDRVWPLAPMPESRRSEIIETENVDRKWSIIYIYGGNSQWALASLRL